MKIGFVSIWFDRGQSVVTKTFMDILQSAGHEIYLFARMGKVWGRDRQETTGEWETENLQTHPTYEIDPDVLVQWAKDNALDVVFFNEEYDFRLPSTVKMAGFKTVTYLDFYSHSWKSKMSVYDVILCSTLRNYSYVEDIPTSHFIGWGVDASGDNIEPQRNYDFFHNAGYVGINFRKGTDLVLNAFNIVKRLRPNATLLLHSQVPLSEYPEALQRIVSRWSESIKFTGHTVSYQDVLSMYKRSWVYLYPAKADGLGLSVPEALTMGLYCIVPSAPPWNEFVPYGNSELGNCLPISSQKDRGDGVAWPEVTVNFPTLVSSMMNAYDCCTMGTGSISKEMCLKRAMHSRDNLFNFSEFSKRVVNLINGLA